MFNGVPSPFQQLTMLDEQGSLASEQESKKAEITAKVAQLLKELEPLIGAFSFQQGLVIVSLLHHDNQYSLLVLNHHLRWLLQNLSTSVEETASSMEQMTSTVKNTTDHTHNAINRFARYLPAQFLVIMR